MQWCWRPVLESPTTDFALGLGPRQTKWQFFGFFLPMSSSFFLLMFLLLQSIWQPAGKDQPWCINEYTGRSRLGRVQEQSCSAHSISIGVPLGLLQVPERFQSSGLCACLLVGACKPNCDCVKCLWLQLPSYPSRSSSYLFFVFHRVSTSSAKSGHTLPANQLGPDLPICRRFHFIPTNLALISVCTSLSPPWSLGIIFFDNVIEMLGIIYQLTWAY